MDEIVTQTLDESGYTKACSYCGVFRRQALNIGAERSHADLIATGHNADDNAETGFFSCLFCNEKCWWTFSEAISTASHGKATRSIHRIRQESRRIRKKIPHPGVKPLRIRWNPLRIRGHRTQKKWRLAANRFGKRQKPRNESKLVLSERNRFVRPFQKAALLLDRVQLRQVRLSWKQ